MTPAPKTLECLLLADDLTGACDAAVHFALRGRRSAAGVSLRSDPRGAQVWAVNAESRDLEPEALEARIAEARESLPVGPDTIIFKKIDSTLRGNAGMESMAALKAFGCDVAVFTSSAVPAMGRMVEEGWLRVAGSTGFAPVELAGWLHAQGVKECAHTRAGAVADAAASGAKLVSLDAICDSDLDRAVAEALALQRRILWVGSAGLAAALARALPAVHRASAAAPQGRGPVLFGIGSTHPATLAQRESLAAARPVARFICRETSAEPVAPASSRRFARLAGNPARPSSGRNCSRSSGRRTGRGAGSQRGRHGVVGVPCPGSGADRTGG